MTIEIAEVQLYEIIKKGIKESWKMDTSAFEATEKIIEEIKEYQIEK